MDVFCYFTKQYGLITRDQARNHLSDYQIQSRLRRGEWLQPQPGVFRHAAVPNRWEARLLAGVLSSTGAAGLRCGAALWNLEQYRHPPIEIVVPRGIRTRREGIRLHTTTQWDRIDLVIRRGIPCTGIERTILDCGAVVGPRTIERLAESAIRQKLTTWPKLLLCLERHSRSGRDGCLNLRSVLERRITDATVPLSDFSRLVVNLLEDAGLPTPEIEYPICDEHGNLVLQVDLAWPSLKKCWELDGLAFHFAREAVERDRRKRNKVKELGWNMQEILWSMYSKEPVQLVQTARRFLAPGSTGGEVL